MILKINIILRSPFNVLHSVLVVSKSHQMILECLFGNAHYNGSIGLMAVVQTLNFY